MSGELSPFISKYWEVADLWKQQRLDLPLNWTRSDLNAAHRFVLKEELPKLPIPFISLGYDLVVGGDFKLPFDRTVFEFGSHDGTLKHVLFCSMHEATTEWFTSESVEVTVDDFPPLAIKIVPFLKTQTSSWVQSLPLYIGTGDKREIPYSIFPDADKNLESLINAWSAGAVGMTTLQGSNFLKQIEVVPPSKLEKHRARFGKPPLFKFVCIELDHEEISKKYHPRGGTHASPMLHWRRGHYRKLQNKVVPVSSCLVGSIKNGLTDKIYKIN